MEWRSILITIVLMKKIKLLSQVLSSLMGCRKTKEEVVSRRDLIPIKTLK